MYMVWRRVGMHPMMTMSRYNRVCMYTCTRKSAHMGVHAGQRVYMYIFIYIYIYIYMYIYIFRGRACIYNKLAFVKLAFEIFWKAQYLLQRITSIYVYGYLWIYIHLCIFVHIYTRIYIYCVCVYIHIYIYDKYVYDILYKYVKYILHICTYTCARL
jgi:hypothetical protein